jgi:hypothetical protein
MSNITKLESVIKHYVVALGPAEAIALVEGHGGDVKREAIAAAVSVFGPIIGSIWNKYKDTKDAVAFMKLYKQFAVSGQAGTAATHAATGSPVAQAAAVAAANPVPAAPAPVAAPAAPEAPVTPAS